MNDDFLKQYWKQPDPAFAEAIYRQINSKKSGISMIKKVTFAFTVFLAVLAFALNVSPRVRGAALEFFREVGGLRFLETSDYPGDGESEEIVGSTYIPLTEARLVFPAAISLPTAIPEGYSLDPDVELVDWPDGNLHTATLTWRKTNPDGSWNSLSLHITYLEKDHGFTEVVGEEALEEITINGKPAVLVRGGWNYDTKAYDLGIKSLRVRWEYGERTLYSLNASNKSLSPGELIAIAESIP